MNNLKDFIKKIQTEKKIQTLNEEATKQSIILPILQMLGWQVFDTDEVFPEYSIKSTRVDYALRNGLTNKVFIEVKRINEDLEKHQEQLLTYSFRLGVHLSILTNGIVWWFYLPLQEGSWEQRKFYAVDMYSQSFEKITTILSDFLTREKVFNGESLNNAKSLYTDRQKKDIVKRNIPIAWRKIHIEGDELLIDLLAETTEKISGYRPEDDQVSEFLYQIANDHGIDSQPIKTLKRKFSSLNKNPESTKPSGNNSIFSLNDNFTYKKIDGFVFLNDNIRANSWKELLVKLVEKIYLLHFQEFENITSISGKKRPYFTKRDNELRSPKKVKGTEYYVETNLSANSIVKIVKDVLKTFKYDESDLGIKLKN